ncbi:MAG: fibronectin type III domain-containing protein [Acidobacteria bacterium]|nr:fibronectin type III domain-containing protein [Acidobacteriota bacterium]
MQAMQDAAAVLNLGRLARWRALVVVAGLAVAALAGGGSFTHEGTAQAAGEAKITIAERTDDSMTITWTVPRDTDTTCGFVVEWYDGDDRKGSWQEYSYETSGKYRIRGLESDKNYTVKLYAMPKSNTEQVSSDHLLATYTETGGSMQQQNAPGRAEPPAELEAAAQPLTAEVTKQPSAHKGKGKKFTVRVRFSEAVESPRASVVAASSVEGGRVTRARTVKGDKSLWVLTIKPTSRGDVTWRLSSSQDCSVRRAVCTEDGRALSGAVSATVAGASED